MQGKNRTLSFLPAGIQIFYLLHFLTKSFVVRFPNYSLLPRVTYYRLVISYPYRIRFLNFTAVVYRGTSTWKPCKPPVGCLAGGECSPTCTYLSIPNFFIPIPWLVDQGITFPLAYLCVTPEGDLLTCGDFIPLSESIRRLQGKYQPLFSI